MAQTQSNYDRLAKMSELSKTAAVLSLLTVPVGLGISAEFFKENFAEAASISLLINALIFGSHWYGSKELRRGAYGAMLHELAPRKN